MMMIVMTDVFPRLFKYPYIASPFDHADHASQTCASAATH